MSEFVQICTVAELPPEGEAREFAAGGKQLCVARVDGEISVMDNECPHRGGPLSEGMIEEGKIVCPWHAWAFDRHSGEAAHDSSTRVDVFELKLDGDAVLVRV